MATNYELIDIKPFVFDLEPLTKELAQSLNEHRPACNGHPWYVQKLNDNYYKILAATSPIEADKVASKYYLIVQNLRGITKHWIEIIYFPYEPLTPETMGMLLSRYDINETNQEIISETLRILSRVCPY